MRQEEEIRMPSLVSDLSNWMNGFNFLLRLTGHNVSL